MTTPPDDGKTYWLDDMRNVRKIVWALEDYYDKDRGND